ncbi:MAG: hypothetical protein K6U74_03795 [Firmicutes bacterium]|nr:hypothetical protein [Bacillota bacterium]
MKKRRSIVVSVLLAVLVVSLFMVMPALAGAPNIPGNPSPADGAVSVGMAPTLSWTGGDPDPGDITTYIIYLSKIDEAGNISWIQVATTTDTSWKIPANKVWKWGLAPNTAHQWYVVAKDSTGLKTKGPVWTFTTGTYPWITGERFNMYLPLSRDNPACRYRPTYYARITGENFGATRGTVKLISEDTGASMWLGCDYGKILSWSENMVEIVLPPAQVFGNAKYPLNSVYKLRVQTAEGVLSNPVWLYIESGGGGTTW